MIVHSYVKNDELWGVGQLNIIAESVLRTLFDRIMPVVFIQAGWPAFTLHFCEHF